MQQTKAWQFSRVLIKEVNQDGTLSSVMVLGTVYTSDITYASSLAWKDKLDCFYSLSKRT